METRSRSTRRTVKVPEKSNAVKGTPKPSRKKAKTEAVKETLNHEEEELIKPDSKPATKISEKELFDGLFLPPDIPSQPKSQPESQTEREDSDLPEKYTTLNKFFNALLNTYMCLRGRKQSCTWSLVKEPVQSLCNSTFELSHIAQMQTVLPGALKLEVWKHTTNKMGRDLSIEIISPSSSQAINFSAIPQLQQSFHNNLLAIAKKNHTEFLKKKKLKAPTSSPYHSSFNGPAVPDIPQSTIPSLFDDHTPVPVKEEDDGSLTSTKATEDHHEEPVLEKPVPAELAGLSAATIAAARASEEAEVQESEDVKITRRLPTVARATHHLCVSEKKRAFAKKAFLQQLVECSASPLSYQEADISMEKIAKIVPQWISTYKTEDGMEWIRFNKDISLSSSLSAISKVVQEVVPK